MKLFDIVPDRFFSILSSGKKEIYLEAVMLLREAARSSELTISRSCLQMLFIDRTESVVASGDSSEEENVGM